ncbi:MAG: Ku protein [Opitutales bacterium]
MPSARPIWKGQISFGLVSVPITLYSAEQRNDIHFHLIDSRNQARVRYQRVNEDTGEEVPWDQIVKGYAYDDQGYVLLSDEEMREVGAEMTKQIEIEDFVDQAQIDPVYFDKPYYLEPGKSGKKPFALLRETLRQAGKLGIARVVIRAREHLAAVMVRGDLLVLELLRFPQELRDPGFVDVPEADDVKMNQREIDLAMQLVESMSVDWEPARYHDQYRDTLMNYIEDKVRRGELSPGKAGQQNKDDASASTVVDLMDYLKRSVEQSREQRNGKGRSKPKGGETKKSADSNQGGAKKGASRKRAAKTTNRERRSA